MSGQTQAVAAAEPALITREPTPTEPEPTVVGRDDFWVVWRDGGGPPTFRHPTESQARKEAARLARIHPGTTMYVLHAIAALTAGEVISVEIVGDESIPF